MVGNGLGKICTTLRGQSFRKRPSARHVAALRTGTGPESNVAAVAELVFGVAAEEEESGFFVALFVEVVEEGGIGMARHLGGDVIQAREEGHEVGLGIGRGHGFDGVGQFGEGGEQIFFERRVHRIIIAAIAGDVERARSAGCRSNP